jgi:hypothetical protein
VGISTWFTYTFARHVRVASMEIVNWGTLALPGCMAVPCVAARVSETPSITIPNSSPRKSMQDFQKAAKEVPPMKINCPPKKIELKKPE